MKENARKYAEIYSRLFVQLPYEANNFLQTFHSHKIVLIFIEVPAIIVY